MKYPAEILEAMTERAKQKGGLREDIQEWSEIARLIREGQQLRKAENLPPLDADKAIKEIKSKYIESESAVKAAQWAFDNIPGFSVSLERSKKLTAWIIDHESSGDADIDAACKKIRRARRRHAGLNPYYVDRTDKRAQNAAAAVTGGKNG